MSGTVQRAAEKAVTERYEALLRVSQKLISIRSTEELFRLLARELRAVVNFYVMGVGIYDEKAHEVRLTSYGEPGAPLEVPKLAPEETFTWWVYQHQQPLIIPSLEAETRFPAVGEMLKNRGVRSVCALPLTTVHRRLGGLAVGSIEADAYSKEEVNFLSLVANQVALAVDDALNFDALQDAKEALRKSEESFRLTIARIPGLVNTMSPSGELEFANQRWLDYHGKTLEELKGWETSEVSHVIVLFDFIEEMHEKGEPLERALPDAGIERIRPVMITVGATILALFPLALEGGPLWKPLCYAQIGGLAVATFITLLLVPVFYSIFVLDLKWITWDVTVKEK